jgi:hypothetical protein
MEVEGSFLILELCFRSAEKAEESENLEAVCIIVMKECIATIYH